MLTRDTGPGPRLARGLVTAVAGRVGAELSAGGAQSRVRLGEPGVAISPSQVQLEVPNQQLTV
jgi:hypothetical protein